MTSSLTRRLQDIPGVASVAVDLTDSGGGINVRLEPGADETMVMEELRSLLVAYGVRSPSPSKIRAPRSDRPSSRLPLGVEVKITPIESGARVVVSTSTVRSFRVVAATPRAIAQGLADAWCQVVGRIPVEIVRVSLEDAGRLTVVAFDGERESQGIADVGEGWEDALAQAVGDALGPAFSAGAGSPIAVNS